MTIKELFKKLQNNFNGNELNGEMILHGDKIYWECDMYNDNLESKYELDFDGDIEPDFESETLEEQLNNACNNDLDLIEAYLDELDEYDNFEISESKIGIGVITFTIS